MVPGHLEVCAARVKMGGYNKSLLVVSVYCPRACLVPAFYAELEDTLLPLVGNSQILIAGDTNCNVRDPSKGEQCKLFEGDMGVVQVVQVATHKQAVIDHIYVDKKISVLSVQTAANVEKHHLAVVAKLSFPEAVLRRTASRNVRIWAKADWDSMERHILNQNLIDGIDAAADIA